MLYPASGTSMAHPAREELLLCWNLCCIREELVDLMKGKKKRKERAAAKKQGGSAPSSRVLTRSKGGCSRRVDHQDGPGYVFASSSTPSDEDVSPEIPPPPEPAVLVRSRPSSKSEKMEERRAWRAIVAAARRHRRYQQERSLTAGSADATGGRTCAAPSGCWYGFRPLLLEPPLWREPLEPLHPLHPLHPLQPPTLWLPPAAAC